MRVRFQDFDAEKFSFNDEPVLVIEGFWSAEEMKRFRHAMQAVEWKQLKDLPDARSEFQGCGNWLQGKIADSEWQPLTERLLMPCIKNYVESFSGVSDCRISLNYYSYGAGDCLSMHNDFKSFQPDDPGKQSIRRRIALATYLHEEWQVNWGGELMLYDLLESPSQEKRLELFACLPPKPGSLVLFTVPRFHRVCRVDPFAGKNKRLSVAGWFITDHEGPRTQSGIVLGTRNI